MNIRVALAELKTAIRQKEQQATALRAREQEAIERAERAARRLAKHAALSTRQQKNQRETAALELHMGEASFRAAVEGTVPLPPSNRVHLVRPKPPLPLARSRAANAATVLPQASSSDWLAQHDAAKAETYLKDGVPKSLLGKLKRGQYPVDASLDLHGLTADQASIALATFVSEQLALGHRTLRMIHGQGHNSQAATSQEDHPASTTNGPVGPIDPIRPNLATNKQTQARINKPKPPILKRVTRGFLAHHEQLLAFCNERREAGGAGAVLTRWARAAVKP